MFNNQSLLKMTLASQPSETLETRSMDLLPMGRFNESHSSTVASIEWQKVQKMFNQCKNIILVGHGGNLAVADHGAVDIARLSKNKKTTFCPGSAIVATSLINDTSFDAWMMNWLIGFEESIDISDTLVIGISSSGRSSDIKCLFDYCNSKNYKTALITAKKSLDIDSDVEVLTKTATYHESEIMAITLCYQLVHGFGYTCPSIN